MVSIWATLLNRAVVIEDAVSRTARLLYIEMSKIQHGELSDVVVLAIWLYYTLNNDAVGYFGNCTMKEWQVGKDLFSVLGF